MKIEEYESDVRKKILLAMVNNDSVLARIAQHWGDRFRFDDRFSNLIGKWCVDFFARYERAPKDDLIDIFKGWAARKAARPELVNGVEAVLVGLSDDENRLTESTDRLMDMAYEHFDTTLISTKLDVVRELVTKGDIAAAYAEIETLDRVDYGEEDAHDLITDPAALDEVFEALGESVIRYNKGLGKFFGPHLEPDGFISFMGEEKIGKSFWLIDAAYQAVRQRKRVAFFACGDLSSRQNKRRLLSRFCGLPARSTNPDGSWPCTVRVPQSIRRTRDRENPVELTYREETFNHTYTREQVEKKLAALRAHHIRTNGSTFKLSSHSNFSIDVRGIQRLLNKWNRHQGWRPDVVVIDYADILAPPTGIGKADVREQINVTWKMLRKLAGDNQCLVITATQADAASYGRHTLDKSNFSEDHRKFAHVTGMIGINQTAAEKELQVYRLNWVQLREGHFNPRRCVYTACCLPLAKPAVLSVF